MYFWAGQSRCRLSMATSYSFATERLVLKTRIFRLFDLLVCSDEVSSGKPNPTLFFQVHAIAGFLSAKALIFEVSDIGIEAAHGA